MAQHGRALRSGRRGRQFKSARPDQVLKKSNGKQPLLIRLLIVRHGQTEWNVQGRNQGHTDIGLDQIGILQSEQVAEHLSQEKLSGIYSSSLIRASYTANIIAKRIGINVTIDDRLRERDYGKWEGLSREEVMEKFPQSWKAYSQDPSLFGADCGESGLEVYSRCASFLSESLMSWSDNHDILIVSHVGTIANLISVLLDANPSTASTLRIRNCSITEIIIESKTRKRLVRFDDVSHLTPENRVLTNVSEV